MNITDTILEKMSDVFKPQRRFISVVLTTIMLMRGNVNFRNMSRYSLLSEKTFSRQFRNPFDFAQFNRMGTETVVSPHTTLIAAIDCSFIPKSGNATYGLAMFYNGSRSEAEKGLEISQLAVADVGYNTAYGISTWQTPDTFISGHTTRTDWYPEHFVQDAQCLPPSVRYVASDGFYAKKNLQTAYVIRAIIRSPNSGTMQTCATYTTAGRKPGADTDCMTAKYVMTI